MKKLSIILIIALVALASCTKSKEVHPEIGDGNDEIVTVGMKDVHVEYSRTDHAELHRVVFHYSLAETQQFASAEMTKRETFFELTLNDLLGDTLYYYYFELFPIGSNAYQSEHKTFHTQFFDTPQPPTPPVAELPTVITAEVNEITENSAQCGGEVTNDGGAEVIERGICWSTNANPTINDSHESASYGIGSFLVSMNDLQANTTYYVRAYATNSVGTSYGADKEFATLSGGGTGVPEGAINGLFTINENGDQVYFSKGNLQYQASTNTWRFAENQWDFVGDGTYGTVYENGEKCNNEFISSNYNGWIDLFGWGTSGWNNGNVYYQPYDCQKIDDESRGYGYGPTDGNSYEYDLVGDYAMADWGCNPIYNGGNQPNQWRILLDESGRGEWDFLCNNRITLSGYRFAKAKVNGVKGGILFPDNWDAAIFPINEVNQNEADYTTNIISTSQWEILEQNGAVFIPQSGERGEPWVSYIDWGFYWLASNDNDGNARFLSFTEYGFGSGSSNKCSGLSVRLVRDANP